MKKEKFFVALEKLAKIFETRNWKYLDVKPNSRWTKTFQWPGDLSEEIIICVHKGNIIQEPFHRQDFFFFSFAYKEDFEAFSQKYDNKIIVKENECYISQPYVGYALNKKSENEFIIIGVLIQKTTFYRSFLPILSSDVKLFHFFLDIRNNEYSEEYIHLKFDEYSSIRFLLEMMVIEYAEPKEDTQALLKSLVLTFLIQLARQYKLSEMKTQKLPLSKQIIKYMSEHLDSVSLKEIAQQFSYHPNYISALLHKEEKRTFSEILMELRMERAIILLKGTDLPIEEISFLLGYSNSSNFYKAFREYYKSSPREYIVGNK